MVALLAEGVDRNSSPDRYATGWISSPSSRRAWIEIGKAARRDEKGQVALLAEGVDRNLASVDADPDKNVALLAEGVDRNA